MKIYNCHTHSGFSHDGKGSISNMAEYALSGKLRGFAITDHCDCEYYNNKKMITDLSDSFEESQKEKDKYKNRVDIISGIEIGDALYAPEFAKSIVNIKQWDVILGSVHAVRIVGKDMPFSLIDFTDFTDEEINAYVDQYFCDLLETAQTTDYDILSHLTVVFRYIKYKYNKNISYTFYLDKIEKILKTLIQRDKTLEINISGYKDDYLMPDTDILKIYKELGGTKFSIGNDSHRPEDISLGFAETLPLLRKLNIDKLIYYKNRQAIEYSL